MICLKFLQLIIKKIILLNNIKNLLVLTIKLFNIKLLMILIF
jgi:hypothetical protein